MNVLIRTCRQHQRLLFRVYGRTNAHVSSPLRAFAAPVTSARRYLATNADVENGAQAQTTTTTTATTTTSGESTETKSLREQVEELKKQLDEAKKTLQYAVAETENVRRVGKRDAEQQRDFGIRSFAKDLLDVSDNFERALDASKAAAERLPEVKALFDGVTMTETLLHKTFEKHGVSRFNALGEKFDPTRHSALLEMPSDAYADGHVGLVMKNGFLIGKLERKLVLRPADVGVVKQPKPVGDAATTKSE